MIIQNQSWNHLLIGHPQRSNIKNRLLRRRRQGGKVPKVDIPGSAKRGFPASRSESSSDISFCFYSFFTLKIKEKTVLTDVFSKYGLKAGLASTRKS
uniref:Uncharacterized protein n=1 Tax=Salix viminalis TaxID=40686 RepID=A0A6N2MEI6_SALVM